MNIVRELLRGSFEIDGMRSDIHQIIGMLVGLAQLDKRGDLSGKFGNEFCTWEYQHSTELRYTAINCHIRSMGPVLQLSASFEVPHNSELYFPARNVQAVHAALPIFIEGMLQEFGGMREEIEPFLKAAEAVRK